MRPIVVESECGAFVRRGVVSSLPLFFAAKSTGTRECEDTTDSSSSSSRPTTSIAIAMWAEDNHYLPKKKIFAKNPLLRHSRVGKRRERTDRLPAENFTYGRPGATGEPTAGEVIHQWTTPSSEEAAAAAAARKCATPNRDFVRTNKEAVDRGYIDAKQNATFRHEKMYRQRKGPFPNKEEESYHGKLDKMTFGMKNKASTPIQRVITGEFHRKFVDRQKKILRPKPAAKRLVANLGNTQKHLDVRRADMHSAAAESRTGANAAEPFKMKQFLDVGSRVAVPNPRYRQAQGQGDIELTHKENGDDAIQERDEGASEHMGGAPESWSSNTRSHSVEE